MFSQNEWVVNGMAITKVTKPRGLWVTVSGIAENPTVFKTDNYRFECWISNRVLGSNCINKNVRFAGHFRFRKQDCYFIVDRIL